MVTIVLNITSLCFWLVVMGSIFRPTISPRHLVRCSFGFLADGQGWKTLGIRGTIDGRNPANQLRLVVYPTIYRVFLHPRWWSPDFWTINSMVSSCLSSSECWISTENIPWKTGAGNITEMFFQLFKESANFARMDPFINVLSLFQPVFSAF